MEARGKQGVCAILLAAKSVGGVSLVEQACGTQKRPLRPLVLAPCVEPCQSGHKPHSHFVAG
jgi:hypothetical protein